MTNYFRENRRIDDGQLPQNQEERRAQNIHRLQHNHDVIRETYGENTNRSSSDNDSNSLESIRIRQNEIIYQYGGESINDHNIIYHLDDITNNTGNINSSRDSASQSITSDLTLPRYEAEDPLASFWVNDQPPNIPVPAYQTRQVLELPPVYDTTDQARTNILESTRLLCYNNADSSILEAHYPYPDGWKGLDIPHELESMTSFLDHKELINALKSLDDQETETFAPRGESVTRRSIDKEEVVITRNNTGNETENLLDKPLFASWIERGREEYRDQPSDNRVPLSGNDRLNILCHNTERAAFFIGRKLEEGNIQGNDFKDFRNYMYDTICKSIVLGQQLHRPIPLSMIEGHIRSLIDLKQSGDQRNASIQRIFKADMQQFQRLKGWAEASEDNVLYNKSDSDYKKLESIYRDARAIGKYEATAMSKYERTAIGSIDQNTDLKPREERWERISKMEVIEQLHPLDLVALCKHEFKHTALKWGETRRNSKNPSEQTKKILQDKANKYVSALKIYKNGLSDNNKKLSVEKDIKNWKVVMNYWADIGKKSLNELDLSQVKNLFLLEYEEKSLRFYQSVSDYKKAKDQLEEARKANTGTQELEKKTEELYSVRGQCYTEYKELKEQYKLSIASLKKYQEQKNTQKTLQKNKLPHEAYKALVDKYQINVHPDFLKHGFEDYRKANETS